MEEEAKARVEADMAEDLNRMPCGCWTIVILAVGMVMWGALASLALLLWKVIEAL